MSIYAKMIALGVPIDNHESDLYVPVTPETTAALKAEGLRCEAFTNQIDGRLWYDVPFAYLPWWERRTAKVVQS